jgi:hypothetical protein
MDLLVETNITRKHAEYWHSMFLYLQVHLHWQLVTTLSKYFVIIWLLLAPITLRVTPVPWYLDCLQYCSVPKKYICSVLLMQTEARYSLLCAYSYVYDIEWYRLMLNGVMLFEYFHCMNLKSFLVMQNCILQTIHYSCGYARLCDYSRCSYMNISWNKSVPSFSEAKLSIVIKAKYHPN